MTNNSGKFRFKMSHSDSDIYRTDSPEPAIAGAAPKPEDGADTPLVASEIPPLPTAMASEIPPLPACSNTGEKGAMHKVRRYLGELWWLWAVAAALYIINRRG